MPPRGLRPQPHEYSRALECIASASRATKAPLKLIKDMGIIRTLQQSWMCSYAYESSPYVLLSNMIPTFTTLCKLATYMIIGTDFIIVCAC